MNAKKIKEILRCELESIFPLTDMSSHAERIAGEIEAKSKEAAVMLSDIEIENLAAKRWKRLNRQKPKMKEGKRQFAIRAFKAGYKAAFGKEGEG